LKYQPLEETTVARTHGSISAFLLICISSLIIGGAVACDNTARGVKQDAQQAEAETRDERAEAAAAAREVGSDVAQAARRAADAAAEAGEEIAERASAATETVDVKTSLMADPSVDATRIDVDTDHRTRTIALRGYVPSETEKDRAAAIARERADGYRVLNNLVVRPRG
jgi:osmotically-inducible protein OsmY